jgi:hypothetical protein
MHDMRGKPINVGDQVLVPCVVTSLGPGSDYCNCSLQTVEPMYPGKSKTGLTLNTRQFLNPEPRLEGPSDPFDGASPAS